MSEPAALKIRLHGEPIGRLTWLDGDRSILSFSNAYASNPDRLVLSLGFKNRYGQLITEHRPYQTRLPPFFSNLLPEGPLRQYLAARAAVKPVREFFLLWALGKDLPGAITVSDAAADWPANGPSSFGELTSDVGRDQGLLRFSLAGVQLKFSAIMGARGGLTIPAEGVGGSWIVKLPSAQFVGVPENEFSMLALARTIGIRVPEIALVGLDQVANLPLGVERVGGFALAIRRFDRADDGSAIHIEDFAQVFGLYPEDKYGRASVRNLAAVIANECGLDDIEELVRRLVFNTLIGNADMHLKNWSLFYPDGRCARLAPAYDFVSTIAYIPDERAALKVCRSARFSAFDSEEMRALADKGRLPRRLVLDTAHATVGRFREVWAEERKHLPMAPDVAEAIDAHLRRIPFFRGE